MMLPIRVLHVVVNMNRGGAETLIMNIYRNIDRSKVQFDFLVHKAEGAYEEEIEKLGGTIYHIPYVTDVGHFGYKQELRKFFEKNYDYKIVHAHMDSMSGLVLKAAKEAGIPVRISHSHNTRNEGSMVANIYKNYIKTKINGSATNFMACSEDAAQWLFGKRASQTLKIKNAIDAIRFKYDENIRKRKRTELGIDKDAYIIGHVGRLCPQKNHTYLLDIFQYFKNINKNAMLLMVGQGPLRHEMEEKAKLLDIESSVIFLGDRGDTAELYQAMDILLFPSLHEGVPLAVIEAQAAGLRCVVSEAVPYCADIGANLVSYLRLEDSAEGWALELEKPYERLQNSVPYLLKSGYHIVSTAEEIQEFYVDKAKGGTQHENHGVYTYV